MDDNTKKKVNKLTTFAQNPELAIFDEIQNINDNLESDKPKKVEIVNEPNDLAKAFFSMLKGEKGDEPSDERLQELITPLIPEPVKGDTGADSTVPGPIGKTGERGLTGPKGEDSDVPGPKGEKGDEGLPGKDGSPDTAEQVRDKLETLKEDDRLDISAIKGFDKTIADIKNSGKTVQIGGGSRGLQLYVGGVKKGLAQYIDIQAGPNMTITDSIVNGLHTLTFTSSGGSGFTTLSATETPNGSTKVFTFSAAAAQPSYLVVDNVWVKPTTASGVVNWTWNAGAKQATLAVAPNEDIWAVV